jgi:GntR family transcriptional repressor for pyruvate dehydrogenase complex
VTVDDESTAEDPGTPAEDTWLRPVRANRVFDEILDAIEGGIRSGELRPGDRIPAERELAARLAVSRTAVREAVRTLDTLGMVTVDRGSKGVRLTSQPSSMLTRYLRLSLALDHFSLESILEFRSVIESWAAQLVAETQPTEIIERMGELIKQMSDPKITRATWRRLHWQFHATLIEGCPNELALTTLRACQEVIASEMQVAFARTNIAHLQSEHLEIYEAIAAGEPARASRLVGEHIARRHQLTRHSPAAPHDTAGSVPLEQS